MDFTQLRAFVTIAREGNLTRAAERLHVTQPAVSLQMKSLQEQLGLQLFNRSSNGMVLTNDGAKLLPYAERVLASSGDFMQAAHALHSTLSGELAIGTILDPEFTRLGVFLKRLVETYPQIATRLQHGMSGWVCSKFGPGSWILAFTSATCPMMVKPHATVWCSPILPIAFWHQVAGIAEYKDKVGKSWRSYPGSGHRQNQHTIAC